MTYVFEGGPPITGLISYIPGPDRFTLKGSATRHSRPTCFNRATKSATDGSGGGGETRTHDLRE